MSPENRNKLAHRVNLAASAALAKQGFVSCIDVLIGMGWLRAEDVLRWRKGQIPYLERAVEANLSRISQAMKLFRAWSATRGLTPRESAYMRKKAGGIPLCFSKSGHPTIERLYRTHWLSAQFAMQHSEKPKKPRPPREPEERPAEPLRLWEIGMMMEIAQYEREGLPDWRESGELRRDDEESEEIPF
jgi:hypothetical protein